MAATDRETELRNDFSPILAEMGFGIVELHSATVNGRVHVELVLARETGISIDDVAAVHKLILPRAELILDDRDVALQVSSPGIDRVFKSNTEFAVFRGRGVSVLMRDQDAWIGGIIAEAAGDSVIVKTSDGDREIQFADIQKARLDFSQEVG